MKVGEVVWDAKVTGIAEADQKAQQFAETAQQTSENAEAADQNLAGAGGSAEGYAGAMEKANVQTDRMTAKTGFLGGKIQGLIRGITSLAKKFLLVVAAGAALVAGIALILRHFGLLDDAINVLIGLAQLWVAVITGDWAQAWDLLVNAAKVAINWLVNNGPALVKAGLGAIVTAAKTQLRWFIGLHKFFRDAIVRAANWIRTNGPGLLMAGFNVVKGRVLKFGQWLVKNFPKFFEKAIVQTGIWLVTKGKELIKLAFETIVNTASNIIGAVGDLITGLVVDSWNATIGGVTLHIPSESVSIPNWVPEIGGRSYTVGGHDLRIPELQTGGLIEEGGAAMLHRGEMVVPADVTQRIQQVFSGGGGGGGGSRVQIGSIEIGDQSLNLDRLTRSDLRQLASLIADELESQTNRRTA